MKGHVPEENLQQYRTLAKRARVLDSRAENEYWAKGKATPRALAEAIVATRKQMVELRVEIKK